MALQGKRAAAATEYQQVLDARRRVLGADHPDTAASHQSIQQLRHGHITSARHLA
jgi:hypothetical protein